MIVPLVKPKVVFTKRLVLKVTPALLLIVKLFKAVPAVAVGHGDQPAPGVTAVPSIVVCAATPL